MVEKIGVADPDGVLHLIPLDDGHTHVLTLACACAPDCEPNDSRRGDLIYQVEHHLRFRRRRRRRWPW